MGVVQGVVALAQGLAVGGLGQLEQHAILGAGLLEDPVCGQGIDDSLG